MRILILGGTTEASALARSLADRRDLACTLSLAGRTADPKPLPLPTRIGGFGGAEGLAAYLRDERVERLIDATHPFAARISRNAAWAAGSTGVTLLAVRRPAWIREPGDDWREVASVAEAADAIGTTPRTVFVTVGRNEAAAFARAPQHAYLVRTIEPLDGALPVPRLTEIQTRGPFDAVAEADFMRGQGVEVLVSKNAGGPATYGKIEAARALGLPVVMVRRPEKPAVACVEDVEGALRWLAE
ncbi:cobalt-precorrin-6A reductase [Methylobacterium radiodurans]|uniref:Cobalt-precorrin-6A reductase n=1 Tax=Methylobacterium radiodurans TaxID=2202828 RepID=A0A2U8VWP6_9HYPH|nr:cobalt-precorrin-6A reductase [Methylobacterium radiodurans]AWN37888.1 cobalt-precorrin-6A reductase [Methylobacterium radiodurans]